MLEDYAGIEITTEMTLNNKEINNNCITIDHNNNT